MAAAATRPRQKGSQQERQPDGPPKTQPGRSARQPSPSLHAPMHPSPTYERLRDDVTRRMRMSPIDQPLML
ncbi:hypothetical protein [Cyanobium sp. ULC082]